MQTAGKMSGLFKFSDWVIRLAYVNALWILFSAAGLFALGFFPATVAMFSITRKWINHETDLPVFLTFWKEFKKECIRANGIGYIFVFIAYFIFIDFQLIQYVDGMLAVFLYVILGTVSIVAAITFILSFPVLAHYQLTFFQYFKYSFLIGTMSPFIIVIALLGSFLWYLILSVVPPLAIFFGGSTMAFVIMWFSLLSFRQLDQQEKASPYNKTNHVPSLHE